MSCGRTGSALPKKQLNDIISDIQKGASSSPELTGSEKQKQWAEDIRRGVYLEFKNIANSVFVAGKNVMTGKTLYRKELTPEQKATAQAVKMFASTTDKVLSEVKQAKTIIDNRHNMNQAAVRRSVENLAKAIMQANGREITQDMLNIYVKKELLRAMG